jgi:hypothetical protein
VKMNGPLGGFGGEIGSFRVDAQRHVRSSDDGSIVKL